MRRHKSTTTISDQEREEREEAGKEAGSFQRRWSFRLPHSTPAPGSSSGSWTALKIPDYFREGGKVEEEERVRDSPSSLRRFVSHSDLSQVTSKHRLGSLHTVLSTPSSSTSSIPAKVKII